MSIPIDAIDPEAASLRARRQFEHHLDLLPPVMDAIVTTTLPAIRAEQVEKRVSGGGHVDNMTMFLHAFDQTSRGDGVGAGGATRDAAELWWMVVDFTQAAAAWIGQPPPNLSARPDADPLTARGVALTTAGWLIDRWELIEPVHELDGARDSLFQTIRRMQGRYGVFANPRRPRARCAVCGLLAVTVTWIDGPNGSPKPIQAARCRNCGQTYTEGEKPMLTDHENGRSER